MKKMNYAFLATVIVALFLSSCAKENNKLDKILTDGTWTIATWVSSNESISNEDQSGPGAVDTKTTSRNTTNFSGSSQVDVNYSETAESPGATTFFEVTYNSTVAMTGSFTEDGTYTITTSKKYNTASARDETGSLGSFNYTDPANTTSQTGYWSWSNTTDTKTQINVSDFGMFDVTLEKGKGTFVHNTSSNNVSNTTAGGFLTITTDTETNNLTFTTTR